MMMDAASSVSRIESELVHGSAAGDALNSIWSRFRGFVSLATFQLCLGEGQYRQTGLRCGFGVISRVKQASAPRER